MSSITLALILLVAMTATRQSQATPLPESTRVCSRTPAVAQAIVDSSPGAGHCSEVTEEQLNAIAGSLDLSSRGITSLQTDDLKGLTAITSIDLSDNQLSTLPAKMFQPLTQLRNLNLQGNPGAPFTYTVTAHSLGYNAFEARVSPHPAFLDITVRLSASEGELPAQRATIATGEQASRVLTIFPQSAQAVQVTLSQPTLNLDTHPGVTVRAAQGICSRTTEIQRAILQQMDAGTRCHQVTYQMLAAVTRPIAIVNSSLPDLRPADLAGLTQVTDVYLYGNRVAHLPNGLFGNTTALERVLLQDNPGADFTLTVDLVTVKGGGIVDHCGGRKVDHLA